jgi:hypothetical protein
MVANVSPVAAALVGMDTHISNVTLHVKMVLMGARHAVGGIA